MILLYVDGLAVSVVAGSTVRQACEAAGVEIPRFCYHEKLGVAGNCRRCLVEVDKAPKPVASCARPATGGRSIFTDTPRVRKAREAVREYLLRHHPLDCPICDQGGECDLQDQSRVFGSDRSRYVVNAKRAVADKDWGPLVKTVRTRCIQCTRCVRFASEVAGVADLGATGRGSPVEIGSYVERPFLSELSGNVVELCPVGALTAPWPTATGEVNALRPWELVTTESIDLTDPYFNPIRLQSKGPQVVRALSRETSWNQGWLADKGRYAPVDGVEVNRVTQPLERRGKAWLPRSVEEAVPQRIAQVVAATEVHLVTSGFVDWQSAVDAGRLRGLCEEVRVPFRHWSRATSVPAASRGPVDPENREVTELLEGTDLLAGREEADAILLVNCDLASLSPVLHSRLRRAYLNGTVVAHWGPTLTTTFPVVHLGLSLGGRAWKDRVHPWLQTFRRPRIFRGPTVGHGEVTALTAAYASISVPRAPLEIDELRPWFVEGRARRGRPVKPGSLLVLLGVTAAEAAAQGLRLDQDVRATFDSVWAFAYHREEEWSHDRVRWVLPLANPYEAELHYVNRGGSGRSTPLASLGRAARPLLAAFVQQVNREVRALGTARCRLDPTREEVNQQWALSWQQWAVKGGDARVQEWKTLRSNGKKDREKRGYWSFDSSFYAPLILRWELAYGGRFDGDLYFADSEKDLQEKEAHWSSDVRDHPESTHIPWRKSSAEWADPQGFSQEREEKVYNADGSFRWAVRVADPDHLTVPSCYDRHREGHPYAGHSATRARVSALWSQASTNFQ